MMPPEKKIFLDPCQNTFFSILNGTQDKLPFHFDATRSTTTESKNQSSELHDCNLNRPKINEKFDLSNNTSLHFIPGYDIKKFEDGPGYMFCNACMRNLII